MSVFRLGCAAIACVLLAACGTVDRASNRVLEWVSPYKVTVVQGNFVSKERVDALKPGMGREQVRDLLGTPLLVSVFHADRWDYVFTFKRQGAEPLMRRLVVFFKNDTLDHYEGDDMPTEAEFVAMLDTDHAPVKVPVLEASKEALDKFPPPPAAAAPKDAPAAPSPPTASYPPLEPAAQ